MKRSIFFVLLAASIILAFAAQSANDAVQSKLYMALAIFTFLGVNAALFNGPRTEP